MWLWIIAVLVLLFILVILTLCVPLEAVFVIDSTAQRKYRLRLVWLFGLTSLDVLPGFSKASRRKRSRRLSWRMLLRIAGTNGFISSVLKLFKGVYSNMRIKELAVKLRFGIDEPVLAGIGFGLVSAVKPLLKLPPQYKIDVGPSFSYHHAIECQAHCTLKVQPISLALPLCRFVLSRPGRRAAKILLFERK